LLGGLGAAASAVDDPIMSDGPIAWLRYGHGKMLATVVVYVAFALLVWAWIRLGRQVLARRVGTRAVLLAAACWTTPLLVAPALFTRDVYSYLAQGALALAGHDPFTVGPTVLDTPELIENVHPFWQDTPAPYGPLFILLVKGVVWLTGSNIVAGVILTRLTQLVGLGLLLWALPGLVRHLGGRLPVAAWLLVAGPLTVVHLVGGPHNDLLMIGFLAAGAVLVLDRHHVSGVALVTLGVAVKASAAVALPFLVWVWAGHLSSTRWRGFARACAGALAVFVAVFAAVTVLAGVDLGWVTMVNASSRLVNWLSVPTALGEILHGLLGIAVDVPRDWVITITRLLGTALLVYIVVRQWWRARDGGPDAVRRAGLALFAVALLSPTMLPWYLTWGLALAAGLAWKPRQLAVFVGVSAFMVAPYSPDGETLLYAWPWMILAVAASVLAAVSLVRPDPLHWSARPVT
ncbi:MAG TPA: polyprenol phosphomannose-dependent alpha 1,6 mannosyltransferase MptB, partial [Actinophytocola sp.]|nr:polyprenol phosphomannose-dependent alpha 1,6 mannosyltransferase MptB [Actinophytocola sp.]